MNALIRTSIVANQRLNSIAISLTNIIYMTNKTTTQAAPLGINTDKNTTAFDEWRAVVFIKEINPFFATNRFLY